MNKVLEGVGVDAPVITNDNGGKQSKCEYAFHLVDPTYLMDFYLDLASQLECTSIGDTVVDNEDLLQYNCYKAIELIARFMFFGDYIDLGMAMDQLQANNEQVVKIAKVLSYGADKYTPNNWRLIPQEDHINHAITHLIACAMGDTQDDHLDHALCRLMMARSTKVSDGFKYNEYVKPKD